MNDFDRIVERRGTGSYKWDGAASLFGREVLPFWVADMDFAVPDPVLEAVRQRAQHPVFGYEAKSDALGKAVRGWLAARHGWDVRQDWLMFCPPSTIVGMIGLVTRLTAPGDVIACHTPGYSPLFRLVEDSDRRLLRCPLAERAGRFHLDAEVLRRQLSDDVRMLLLCNPHNPTGRVFTETELSALADLASEKDLVVVSDEVHCDLVMPGHRHIPFGQLAGERSVTVISPNKTFNTAGMPQSTFVVPDPVKRAAFAEFLETMQLNHESTFGAVAAEAAYRHGAAWLDDLIRYVEGNHRRLRTFLEEEIPTVRVQPAEGSYLAWLDCRETGFGEAELLRRLVQIGGIGLYPGSNFGEQGRGFLRMNVACPRATLEDGLARLARALA